MGCSGSKSAASHAPILDGGPSPSSPTQNFNRPKNEFKINPIAAGPDSGEDISPDDQPIRFSERDVINNYTTQFYKEYEYQGALGQGIFGEVIEVKNYKTNVLRAVKILKQDILSTQEKSAILKEVENIQKLDHPHIMKIHEYYDSKDYLYIIGDVHHGGDLMERIANMANFSEKEAANIISEVLSAVKYCHSKQIIHRDLKPSNILFETGESNTCLKIVNFGLSAALETEKNYNKLFGTPMYMAPEVFSGKYNEKCDIWSIGVIAYILLTGKQPFRGPTRDEAIGQVTNGKYTQEGPEWQAISEEAKNFISRVLAYDPSGRYSAEEALNDDWIVKMKTSDSDSKPLATGTVNNIKKLRAEMRLKEALYRYISAHYAQKSEWDRLIQALKSVSKKKSTALTPDQLFITALSVGLQNSDNEIKEMIESLKVNPKGLIEYSEFLSIAMDRRANLQKERLEATFAHFRKSWDDELTTEEVKDLFHPGQTYANDADWLELIKSQIVESRGGKITYNDFKGFLLKIIQQSEKMTKSKLA